jgi:hypothetical protein
MSTYQKRPIYETAEHLSVERAFAEKIACLWACTLKKLPIRYSLDYCAFVGNNPDFFCELKNRSCSSREYQTYRISLLKWMTGRWLQDTTNKPFYIFVRCKDCDLFLDTREIQYPAVVWGGRTDRGDPADMEPMVSIPINLFLEF